MVFRKGGSSATIFGSSSAAELKNLLLEESVLFSFLIILIDAVSIPPILYGHSYVYEFGIRCMVLIGFFLRNSVTFIYTPPANLNN